ncbi:alpha/beta fold hydrolase [Actinokineospora fastidiosa]|uniref:Alpha/beta hydrolase n=1 Tax=Actinokineospora fastidiosa TaxID=1816 RepID=A0A918LJM6_9PSEU|nr:alpha/beta fold hydrolase [Actinokineospora fastidiosa]GGS56561.1 alpha/beta hydrolase [Actinokineospora fastidiosa]
MPLTYRRPDQVCVEHTFTAPLDHADPAGPAIEVFATEVVRSGNVGRDLPTLLYLQGGPGHAADRPSSGAAWLARALRDYRVVLLDQRGTGRSTPATRQSLEPFTSKEQAAYLRHFRADSIVRDAELVRGQLIGDRPWSLLGQSFGGFCALTYLSLAPDGLAEVMIAGGLPGLTTGPDEVYRAAYPRAVAHNERFFARYPGDRDIARAVAKHLADTDTRMPTGERLTPERFRMLGLCLGMAGSFDLVHHLLSQAFIPAGAGPALSDAFLRGVDGALSMAERPLYALLHESIYCQDGASGWSAHRVGQEFPEFGADVLFTAEMFYPWLFEQDPSLAPLRDCAHLLAATPWPPLYDLGRLSANTVPVAAVVYFDDLYVDRGQSLATAALVRELRPWVTNEFGHEGVGSRPGVFDRLRAMVAGEAG